jgi:hypothetical protein
MLEGYGLQPVRNSCLIPSKAGFSGVIYGTAAEAVVFPPETLYQEEQATGLASSLKCLK